MMKRFEYTEMVEEVTLTYAEEKMPLKSLIQSSKLHQ